MIKDGGLSFETQLKIEILPPHNGSKKMLGKNTEEGWQETALFLTILVHSWRRVPNPHYISYPTSSNFVQPPPPLPPPPHTDTHTHCSFFCLVSLTKWVIVPRLMCYFT